MCLNDVYVTRKRVKKPSETAAKDGTFFGYKSFVAVTEDGKIHAGGMFNNKPLSIGKWMRASDRTIKSNNIVGERYTSGFHIFLKEIDAKKYRRSGVTFLIEFKDIVAIGKQNSYNRGLTVIAKKIRIIKRV